MEKKKINRRDFLRKSSVYGTACCGLLLGMSFNAKALFRDDELIDPKKLNYCGYTCPADCKFLKATLENDVELKKEAYKDWKIKEKYDIDFDAEKIFCYGCKTPDKPEGVTVTNCPVRNCAKSKGFDSCIECKDLTTCDKAFWTTFPDFYTQVKEMQVKYQNQ